jgi:hypothetical protein
MLTFKTQLGDYKEKVEAELARLEQELASANAARLELKATFDLKYNNLYAYYHSIIYSNYDAILEELVGAAKEKYRKENHLYSLIFKEPTHDTYFRYAEQTFYYSDLEDACFVYEKLDIGNYNYSRKAMEVAKGFKCITESTRVTLKEFVNAAKTAYNAYDIASRGINPPLKKTESIKKLSCALDDISKVAKPTEIITVTYNEEGSVCLSN